MNLAKRTASDRFLRDKAFNVAENLKYDGYQRGLAFIVYTFSDKKTASLAGTSASVSGIKNEIKQNE